MYITSRSPADYVHGLLSHLQLCLFTQVETSSDSCMVVSGLPERNGNKHAGEIASIPYALLHRPSRSVICKAQRYNLELEFILVGI